MDDWATHIPVLVSVACRTNGPIIELGCGDYSTPVLHMICAKDSRKLLSTDEKLEWSNRFLDLQTDWHKIVHVSDWANFSPIDEAWDVAFVDHAPGERRIYDIERLMNRAKFIVVHDSQNIEGYKYDIVFPKFKYQFDYTRFPTWTTVLSQTEPLDFLR